MEAVILAALPGDNAPDVHVAQLDPKEGVLTLQEASLQPDGSVSLGRRRDVSLAQASSVRAEGSGEVMVLGNKGQMLVQLLFESDEDECEWIDGLRDALPPGSSEQSAQGKAEEADKDVCGIRARSQQLQTRVGSLEAISQRRDMQLKKMLKRLEGANTMLTAIQDMCGQQRNVIEAQRQAISELQQDDAACGGHSGLASSTSEEKADGNVGSKMEGQLRDDLEARHPEAEQMFALLKQADEMQAALRELKSLKVEAEGAAAAAVATTAAKVAAVTGADPRNVGAPGGDYPSDRVRAAAASSLAARRAKEDDEAKAAALLSQLTALDSEKARFEGLLANGQNEHDSLQERLEQMRSLMSRLGMEADE